MNSPFWLLVSLGWLAFVLIIAAPVFFGHAMTWPLIQSWRKGLTHRARIFAAAACVLGMWVSFFHLAVSLYGEPDSPGIFGDLFGAVNALFTGIAFVGLVITIRGQESDRREARIRHDEEVALIREQLRQAAEAARAEQIRLEAESLYANKQLKLALEQLDLERREKHQARSPIFQWDKEHVGTAGFHWRLCNHGAPVRIASAHYAENTPWPDAGAAPCEPVRHTLLFGQCTRIGVPHHAKPRLIRVDFVRLLDGQRGYVLFNLEIPERPALEFDNCIA